LKKKNDKTDDRTIVNMNVEGMPWYVSEEEKKKQAKADELKLGRKEKRAAFLGAVRAYLPMLICILCGFGLTILLLWLWLK
jgi:hypothetical protein